MVNSLLRQLRTRGRSVRRRLLRDLVLVLVVTVGTVVGAAYLVSEQVRQNIAKGEIQHSTVRALEEFQSSFGPVVKQLLVTRAWGHTGDLPLDDVPALNSRFMPALQHLAQVSGLIIADAKGREYFLLREQDRWLTRTLVAGKSQVLAQWTRWSSPSQAEETWQEELDYDPRTRPWFKGAAASVETGNVFWTRPYVFFTRQAPGITAATAWHDGGTEGRLYVVGLDILLSDVVAYLRQIKVRERGRAFLFSDEGGVFVPPDGSGVGRVRRNHGAFFSPSKALGSPAALDALEHWENADRPMNEPMRFRSGGEWWWGQFQPVYSDSATLWFGVVVPESDFLGILQTQRSILIWIAVAVVLAGVILAALVVGRYGRQMKDMAKTSLDPRDFEQEVLALIHAGESATLEFKSTMRMNLRSGKAGKEIELAWLKSVVGFMNTDGGVLLIGVDDGGEVVGTEPDGFENEDRCRLHFKNLFTQHIGLEYSKFVELEIQPVAGKTVVAVECERSGAPVFLRTKNDEAFYIRSGPSSVELSVSKALKYIQQRS